MSFKSGFVAIIGRPNVGKSTLMNALIKQKVAIVSDKVQTTRNKIQGIYTDEHNQIIFIDTPGIHKAFHELGKIMNKEAFSSLNDCEAVILLVDATKKFGKGDEFVLSILEKVEAPVFLVINKVDISTKEDIDELTNKYKDLYNFKDIIIISAKDGYNLDTLLNNIKEVLPNGPKYYPDGYYSDHPESFIMAEIIREKVLLLTEEEVPHSVATYIERMENIDEESIEISAVIVVERNSQKGIIIGKDGAMIKKIRQLAQREIKKIFDSKVRLEIFVRVEKNWRNKHIYLKELGYK
jgi:GTP-binding protein Era